MNHFVFFLLFLCVQAFNSVKGDGFYTIVAPGSMRQHSKYHMSLATTGLKEPMKVLITITNGYYKQEKLVTVPPVSAPTIVALEIGSLASLSRDYSIRVKGLSGIIFEQAASLYLNWKEYIIIFQTDKAFYKPSDRVRFRALVVDSDTKPVNLDGKKVEAFIQDPLGNKVKIWENVKLVNGVFKGDLKLSDEPVYGVWLLRLSFDSGGNTIVEQKTFQVAEYVLPKFEIITSQPVSNIYKNGKVVFVVEAKYTNGRPVKGTVTVRFDNPEYTSWSPWGYDNQTPEKFNYKTIPIDGKLVVEFDLRELKISPDTYYTMYLNFELTVLEEMTGIKEKTTLTVPIYDKDYKITELVAPEATFKPGLPYSFYVKVTSLDDKPIIDKKNPVICTYIFDDAAADLAVELNDQGMAFVSFTAPLKAKSLHFFVKYRDIVTKRSVKESARSESNTFIQANILTKPLEIFKSIKVQVQATENMKYFYYQVIGKGGVLISKRVNCFNLKTMVFSFWATFDMMPNANLVIYYYRSNGEIVPELVKLKFNFRLDNYAKVKLSTTQVEPGKLVDITVDSKCNSYVGLLGIDQSVKLLASGNDIDKSQVYTEMGWYYSLSYKTGPEESSSLKQDYYLVGQPSYAVLVESGSIFFTNAKVYELIKKSTPNTKNKSKKSSPMSALASGSPRKVKKDDASFNPATVIRQDFPETWIWEDIMNDNCDPIKLTKKVPDTITSWLITAFSLNQANGLGLSESPTSLQVFRPFFISISLPYSIKRGEHLTLSVQIFNYLSSDQDVLITMANEAGNFEFTDETDSNYETSDSRMTTVTVQSNAGTMVTFKFKAKKLGYLPVKIAARCEVAGDTSEQLLLVEPEGTPVFVNKAVLLDLRTVNTLSVPFSIDLPEGAVLDFSAAQVSVFGDIITSVFQNAESQIRYPTGSGEENMEKFVVNLLLAEYLDHHHQKSTINYRSEIVAKLAWGYQHQLNFQMDDGSFATLSRPASTWLTASAVRFFARAKKYIKIDDRVMSRALNWLVAQQFENGRFNHTENSYILNAGLKSDANGGVGLTAFVLLALQEQADSATKYGVAIKKATDYIIEQLKTVNDMYSLAISAYALQKQGHPSASTLMKKLNEKALVHRGFKWWEDNSFNRVPSISSTYYFRTPQRDIEITALALATYAEAGMASDVFPIVHWLIKEQNAFGTNTYTATQDIMLGFLALAKIGNQLFTKETNIDIALSYNPNNGLFNFKVTRDNAFALQNYVLPPNTKTIRFDCKGAGAVVAQVSHRYYTTIPESTPRFNLDIKVLDSVRAGNLKLKICTSFVPDETAKTSNRVIVEVTFPSGYTFHRDTLVKLRSTTDVSRVETKNQDSVLIIIYDGMSEKEVCFEAEAVKTTNVALLKPVPVVVYDSKDNSRRARKFYDLSSLNIPTV